MYVNVNKCSQFHRMWRLERVLIDGYNIPKESSDSRDESFFSFATLLRNCDFGAALIHPFIKDVVSPILKSSMYFFQNRYF